MSASRSGVVCPPVLDLAYAPELKDVLLRALAEDGDVEVRAAEVTQADTACLQIFCAAAAALARDGRSLIVVEPSPALTRVAERLGLARALGLGRTAVASAGSGSSDADKEK